MKPSPIPDDVSGEDRPASYSLRRGSVMKERADDDKPFEGGTLAPANR